MPPSKYAPGILCWIRGSSSFAGANNGRVVELTRRWLEPLPSIEEHGNDGRWWVCTSRSPLRATHPHPRVVHSGLPILIHQHYLVPINDPDLGKSIVEQELLDMLSSQPSKKIAKDLPHVAL